LSTKARCWDAADAVAALFPEAAPPPGAFAGDCPNRRNADIGTRHAVRRSFALTRTSRSSAGKQPKFYPVDHTILKTG
jgi:hypothetical protein